MDKTTKRIVFGWCCAALAAIVYFSRAPWPALPALTAGSFVVMALATALNRRFIAVLLLFTYVFPIVVRTVTGLNYSPFGAVWIGGLLGAMAPDIVRTRWHVARRWRSALICWALIVVVGTGLVVLREFDFTWVLVHSTGVANSSAGGWPSFVVTWALHSSLVLLSGILWFDWLCGMPRDDFRPAVVVPVAASGAVMVAVAVYQLVVDVTALNPTVYGAIGRASGTVMDANLAGTIAGVWIGGSALLFWRAPQYRVALLTVSIAACWLAVWASGSRTGFGAAIIVSAYLAMAFTRARRIRSGAAALITGLALIAVVALSSAAPVVGPVQRIRAMLPSVDAQSVRALASELWNRNGYGAIATAMIGDFPVFGVGMGGFHAMQADFARSHGLPIIPSDNAQNWYRHQVAEFGIAGSLGWLWWAIVFGMFVLRRTHVGRTSSGPPRRDAQADIARGMIVAFAAVSLVGMPGQEIPAAFTFWLAAFWYVFLLGAAVAPEPRISRREWPAVLVIVALFAVGTAWTAIGALRVPARAQRFGWPYSYGFYNPATRTFGQGPGWTGRRAVWVFQPASEWIALTVSSDYRAVSGSGFSASSGHVLTRPSEVRLWCNGSPLLRTRLTTTAPHVTYVRVPADQRWLFVESAVSRVVSLRELGMDEGGEIGVRIDWAPAGAPLSPDQAVTCGSSIARINPPSSSAAGRPLSHA